MADCRSGTENAYHYWSSRRPRAAGGGMTLSVMPSGKVSSTMAWSKAATMSSRSVSRGATITALQSSQMNSHGQRCE